ncbi:MAG: fibronectin type III domain-containing protein [Firmicutes bacterium]|nr:fibronectin type III domain-containing protein [Bacillota bacterium]
MAFAESESSELRLSYASDTLFVDEDGMSWVQRDVDIKPPVGYQIGSLITGPWTNDWTLTGTSTIPSVVYLMEDDGSGEPVAVEVKDLKRDMTMPTAELSLSRGEESWDTIFSFITMDTFWKGSVTAEITASDEESGVKTIEYFISDRDLTVEPNQGQELLPQKLERLVDGQWQTYDGPVSLREKATNVVYGKITDNVGNVKYVGSTGQNLYEDSQVSTAEAVYYKGTVSDKAIDVDLKENTVASVSIDDVVLSDEFEYEVTTDQITLKGSCLERLDVGEHFVTIAFAPLGMVFDEHAKGDAPGKETVCLKVEVDTSKWGEKISIADIPHYVQQDGTTSVKVDGNDFIWLKESSEGVATWFGLDNRTGTFEKGSRFWVRILNKNENPMAWQQAYEQLDQHIKDAIEDQQVMLFEIGVTDADGTAYHEFEPKTAVSVQMTEGWDEGDMELIFVNGASDVQFVESVATQKYPQGEGRFLTAELSYFSCYAAYDGLSEAEKEALKPQQPGNDGQQGESIVQPEGPAGGGTEAGDTTTPNQPENGDGAGGGTTTDPETNPGTGGSSGGGTTPTPGTGGSTTPGAGTTPGTGGSGSGDGGNSDGGGTPMPTPTPMPAPGTGDNTGGNVTPTPTPGTPDTGTPDAHQHSYIKTVTKATAKKDGSIVEKCACGDVKNKAVIKKASKIKLSKSSYVYTGKVIKAKNLPKVIVKDSAGKTIAAANYTVVKPKNVKKMKALGKYAYTIKFKGNKYKGSVKVYLEITPAKVTAKTPKAAKKAVTVKWKKGKKAQVTGYQVTVSTNKKFTKNVKTKKIKGYSKTSYKMTKLKAKTKYYVKVRAYKVTKTGTVYSKWSSVKTIRTK